MDHFNQKGTALGKVPFLPIGLSFAAGIVTIRFIELPIDYVAITFFLLLSITILIFFKHLPGKPNILFWFIILFYLMGMIRYAFWKDDNLEQPYLEHLPMQVDTVKATVLSTQTKYRMKAIAELNEFIGDSTVLSTAGKILIYFPYQFDKEISPGNHLILIGPPLNELPQPRNPGQFDYGKYLRDRGIVAECKIEQPEQVVVEGGEKTISLKSAIFAPVRKELVDNIERYCDSGSADFLKALLLGMRSAMEQDVLENFQKAGVMHVLAISGLHVGFVALIFYIVLSFFPIYFKHRNIMVICLLVFYMFLTGSKPPVVRATLMVSLYFIAINLERRSSIYNFLFAAAFLVLLFQPQQICWVGFQFSFAAVLSIVYFYQKLEPFKNKILQFIKNETLQYRIGNWIIAPFLVSLSAQLGTIPLVMHYFHKFSLISFFLNILVIPYIGVLVGLGFLFLILSLLSMPLAQLFANFLSLLINGLLNLVSGAANLPTAYFNISTFSVLEILIYLSVVLLLFNFKKTNFRNACVYSFLTFAVLWGSIRLTQPSAFNLIIMDVGQGDAALVSTPQKKALLFDTGPANQYSSAADAAIIPVMHRLGVKRVHHLFISHPHADHLGGTFRLLEYADIDSVYLPEIPISYHWQDTLLQVLNRFKIPYRYLKMGDRIIVDEETRIYVTAPFPQFSKYMKPAGSNLNNNSLVLLLKHRNETMLFTGDVEAEAEAYLELWDQILESDFLKIGHHGSSTSTSEDFLELVNPEIATISAGRQNKFGHPAQKTLRLLDSYEVAIFRTDQKSAIWFQLLKNEWHRVGWRKN